VLTRPCARSITKIRSKNNLYPHRHFTKHLMNAFRKPPWENNLNHETLSLLSSDSRVIPTSPCNDSQQSYKANNRENRDAERRTAATERRELGFDGTDRVRTPGRFSMRKRTRFRPWQSCLHGTRTEVEAKSSLRESRTGNACSRRLRPEVKKENQR
jgi:hypothetical protein